jgi:hypothetical protein
MIKIRIRHISACTKERLNSHDQSELERLQSLLCNSPINDAPGGIESVRPRCDRRDYSLQESESSCRLLPRNLEWVAVNRASHRSRCFCAWDHGTKGPEEKPRNQGERSCMDRHRLRRIFRFALGASVDNHHREPRFQQKVGVCQKVTRKTPVEDNDRLHEVNRSRRSSIGQYVTKKT